jgi:hypothetical protein
MNKQMKQHLEAVVGALVEQDSAAAKAAFHDYLRLKSQSILLGEADDEEKDEKDDKKEDKDDKSDDKDDKKPAFLKKDDKDDKKKSDEDCEM